MLLDALLRGHHALRKMRCSMARVELRCSKHEEGGYMMGYDDEGSSSYTDGLVGDSNKPLGSGRVVAFAREFKLANTQWLYDVAQAVHSRGLGGCTEDMRRTYWEQYYNGQGSTQTAFAYGTTHAAKRSIATTSSTAVSHLPCLAGWGPVVKHRLRQRGSASHNIDASDRQRRCGNLVSVVWRLQ
jgi:hypothetical protein